jgi:hypothetical protein
VTTQTVAIPVQYPPCEQTPAEEDLTSAQQRAAGRVQCWGCWDWFPEGLVEFPHDTPECPGCDPHRNGVEHCRHRDCRD